MIPAMGNNNERMPGQPVSSDPESGSGRRNRRTQQVGAIIAALGAIIAALITTQPWHHDNPCTTNLIIISPKGGRSVANGAQGIKITGTACGMSGKTGWLFDYDPNDQYFYLDYSTTLPSPVTVNNGNWAYYDMPIGNKGDQNQTYSITVVLASVACTNELEKAKPDSAGDFRFKTFPSGCQVEDTADVVVTYP
jgi:hypothetical protein